MGLVISREGQRRQQAIIDTYLEQYPHMVTVVPNGKQTEWCEQYAKAQEWGYCKFSPNNFHYFFKHQAVAVEFALRWI